MFSSAVKVAGSLAVIGGAVAAAAMPAGASSLTTRAWGLSANGIIHISPVAKATASMTPATAASYTSPSFVTTGGIQDRVTDSTDAYSNVGSPKIYLGGHLTDQINADNVMSACRTILGIPFGFTTIQNGSISQIGLPDIALPRHPAINTKIYLPYVTITLNRQSVTGGIRTSTAIYVNSPEQNLSIGVTRCGTDIG